MQGVSITYVPFVSYEYKINNEATVFSGNKLSFDLEKGYSYSLCNEETGQFHELNRLFEIWNKSKNIEIYYNPDISNQSVIFKKFSGGRHFYYILMSILSLTTFVLSGYFLICWTT